MTFEDQGDFNGLKGGGNERGAMSRACQTIEGSTGEKKKTRLHLLYLKKSKWYKYGVIESKYGAKKS